MKPLITTAALFALTPALFAGERIPADLAALIPSDSSSLIYVASIDDLEEAAQELLGVVAPDMAMMADADALLSEVAPPGFNIDLLDRSRPFAVAIGAITMETQNTGPQIFIMIPTTDAATLDQSLPPHASRVSGGYLGICETGDYPQGGGSALPAALPEGLIAATLDAEPIMDTFAPMAGFMLGMAKSGILQEISSDPEMPAELRTMATDTVNAGFRFIDDAMDSFSSFEVAFNLAGTEVDLGYAINFKEGSPLTRLAGQGPTFAEMLPFMDTGAVGNSVVGMDLGAMARWIRPYVDQIMDAIPVPTDLPPDADLGPFQSPKQAMASVREAVGASLDTLGWFGDGAVTSMYFVNNEPQSATWMHGVQAGQLADSLDALFHVELASLAGLELQRTQIGESTTNLALSLNGSVLARNFGLDEGEVNEAMRGFSAVYGDSINLSLTTVGKQTLMIYNGDRESIAGALRAVQKRPGTELPALKATADALGDAYPFGVYHLDLGPFAANMMNLAISTGEGADIPPGLPSRVQDVHVPLTVFEGLTSARMFQGIHIDVAEAGKLIELAR